MEYSKKHIWSLFIVILMGGSILGVLATQGDDNSSNPVPNAPVQTPTVISYEAKGVNAKIIQVFPSAIMLANSDDFDVSSLEAKLLKIEGVISVNNAMFVSSEQVSGGNFKADIKVSSPEEINEIVEKINDITSVSGAVVYPTALVSIPEIISFINPDLNLNIDYNFTKKQAQAIITPDSREGDELLITLSALFEGKKLVQLKGFEENNLTTAFNLYFTDDDFEIISNEEVFKINSEVSLSDKSNIDSAKKFFEEIEDFNSDLMIFPFQNKLTISFEDFNSISESDLNSFFSSNENILAFSISPESTSIDFNSDVDFVQFKTLLENGFSSNNFLVSSIEEPLVSIEGVIETLDKEVLLEKILENEKANSITFEVLEQIKVETDSIFIPDLDKKLPLEQGYFEAFINPSEIEESMHLYLQLYASERDGIVNVSAQITEPTTTQFVN